MSGSTRAPRNIAGGAALRREVAGECKSVEWRRSGLTAGSGASAACVAEQQGPCACETCEGRQAGRHIVALLSAPEASKAVVQGAPEGGSWHRQQPCECHPASERLRPHLHLSAAPEERRGRRKMFLCSFAHFCQILAKEKKVFCSVGLACSASAVGKVGTVHTAARVYTNILY